MIAGTAFADFEAPKLWDNNSSTQIKPSLNGAGSAYNVLIEGNLQVDGTLILGGITLTGNLDTDGFNVLTTQDGDDGFLGDRNVTILDDEIGWQLNNAIEGIFTTTSIKPGSDDGWALGVTSTNEVSDLFLNTGAVIGYENGDVDITHSANNLDFNGATSGYDFDNHIQFDLGAAVTAGNYSIGRDADATNQLHGNVPTGGTYELSVNDVAEMTLSATAVDFQNNSVTTTGGGSLTGTWSDLGTVTTVDINGGTIDGVTIGGTSAGAITGTTITGTSFVIGANTLDTTEWANLDGLNQTVATTSSPAFAGATITQAAATSGAPFAFLLTEGAHTNLTAGAEINTFSIVLSDKQWDTGAKTLQRDLGITGGTYSFVGLSTVSTGATWAVTAAPSAGTNAIITKPVAMLVGGAATEASVAGLSYETISIPDHTITVTGATNVTSTTTAGISIGTITLSNASISYAAASGLYIKSAPVAAGGMTLTNPYAIFVDAGISRFDGAIAFGDETVDIGTSTVGLNDLHFGSGGIINFDGGDVTLTHSANTLSVAGGNLAMGANSITGVGSAITGTAGTTMTISIATASEAGTDTIVAGGDAGVGGTGNNKGGDTDLKPGLTTGTGMPATVSFWANSGGTVSQMMDFVSTGAGLAGFGFAGGTTDFSWSTQAGPTAYYHFRVDGSTASSENYLQVTGGVDGAGAAASAVTLSAQTIDGAGNPDVDINITPIGTGAVVANGLFLAANKVMFTQTDGNEYIDSLADGYLDYSVTTAHRFNMSTADTDVRLEFVGTTTSGLLEWMEDEDYFRFTDSALFSGNIIAKQGTDIASGSTIVIPKTGNTFELTGTTAVNLVTTTGFQDGFEITLVANENVTINHATATAGADVTILLAGAGNFAMTANDTLTLVLSSTTAGGQAWREVSRTAI